MNIDDLFEESDFSATTIQGLVHLLKGPASIAAFDFDNTCIDGDISETLLKMMDQGGAGQLVRDYEAACERDLRSAYIQLVHTLVSGQTEAQVYKASHRAWNWGVSQDLIRPRPGIARLIMAMQLLGWEVYVVTASPTAVVRPHASKLGVHPSKVLGMTSEQDANGVFLPSLIPPVAYREGKGQLLRAHAGKDATFAAGDSQYDMGILAPAQHVLLYDRGDQELRNMATARNWWLEETT